MMMIEQTVEIPVSHRLTIDVPPEVPAGGAVIVFRPLSLPPREGGKIHLTRHMVDKMMESETLRLLTGILHTDMTVDEIRAERLGVHDHID